MNKRGKEQGIDMQGIRDSRGALYNWGERRIEN